ncbi:MAG: archaeosine biosynthesis radical SAM protein RaSEA [bacterium]|nr:archaeosine biosynthesis radical SAM protein RaSEA [bacterium]
MQPAYHKISPINIEGRSSNRLMIVLKTKGCEYDIYRGGCSMCGFLNHAIPGIKGAQIVKQLDYSLETFDMSDVGHVDLLTLGSFFNDSEVNSDTRDAMIERLSKLDRLRRVMVESRAEYVTVNKMKHIKSLLGEGKILEFGIGLESSDDYIRNTVVRKSLSKRAFEKTAERVGEAGATFLAYLLIKPPTLNEKEAIEDAIQSANYVFDTAEKHGVTARVAYEPVFIPENTDIEKMFLNNEYKILNLWSVVTVIERINHLGCIYVGLSDEDLSMERLPHSCPKCTRTLLREIEAYNHTQDITELMKLDCECKAGYLERMENGEF